MAPNLKPKLSSVPLSPLKIWAGIEGTINRVGDQYFDQCLKNKHRTRPGDLERIADLGVKHLRYPFLWEVSDFEFFDRQIAKMEELGIKPIAGLLHHGSGPVDTNLLDPKFPEKFAEYAKAFASRYPQVQDYTPVNEPLTTARFSALYGVWYPHAKSDASFLRALINQIRATILAMKEIRKINPNARLIQTDDLGRTTGTPKLKYQVRFENERRWLSYDLLCGRVNSEHALFSYLTTNGVAESELEWIRNNPCPPDVIGVNHYLLSSRFLDHELKHYAPEFHGGNGTHAYADVAAVDSRRAEMPSAESIFMEAWERYQIPVVITEVHVHGGRETQLRWFKSIYDAALSARAKGANIEAITAWSVFGTYDWNSLCTKNDLFYESGVFDLRSAEPRPTALAKHIKKINLQSDTSHAVFDHEGWWAREPEEVKSSLSQRVPSPLLILGDRPEINYAYAQICQARGLNFRVLDLGASELNVIRNRILEIAPWAVIYTSFPSTLLNARNLPETIAKCARELEIPFVHFSSEQVFDGQSDSAYLELDPTNPVTEAGRLERDTEALIASLHSQVLTLRTSALFGPWDKTNFLTQSLNEEARDAAYSPLFDSMITPTYLPDFVHASLDLLIDDETGIFHLIPEGCIEKSVFIRQVAELAGIAIDPEAVEALSQPVKPLTKPAVLGSARARILPKLDQAILRFVKDAKYLKRNSSEGVYG